MIAKNQLDKFSTMKAELDKFISAQEIHDLDLQLTKVLAIEGYLAGDIKELDRLYLESNEGTRVFLLEYLKNLAELISSTTEPLGLSRFLTLVGECYELKARFDGRGAKQFQRVARYLLDAAELINNIES